MNTFKFRAECVADVYRFVRLGHATNVVVALHNTLPDVTVTFDSTLGLESVKRLMAKIVDGHVMRETVAPVELYTGQRGAK